MSGIMKHLKLNNMTEQTSVRYLSKIFCVDWDDFVLSLNAEQIKILLKADEIHKKEIKNAYRQGSFDAHTSNCDKTAEQYYNEKFKTK